MSRGPRLLTAALLSVVVLALALVLIFSPSHSHGGASPPSTSTTAQSQGFDGAPTPGQNSQNFTLTDQQGRRVSLSDYRGKVVVLAFLSTAPTAAGTSRLMAEQVRGALEELRTPVPVLAVSTNPAADTRARVNDFLRRVSLTGRLRYLTGRPSQLQTVWRTYAITPPRPREHGPDRSAYVLLIDGRGVQRVRFYVEQLTPEGLTHDIRKLQAG
jgi:protein SCO1/2